MSLILASSSPRRKILLTQLLKSLGIKHPRFQIIHANINETRRHGEKPLTFARRLAKEKALCVAGKEFPTSDQQPAPARRSFSEGGTSDSLILSADTIVVLGNQIFGKPRNKKHAAWMLSRLSGRKHKVITAVCAFLTVGARHAVPKITNSTSTVLFHHLSPAQIKAYTNSPEPHDKAGAYAIQGSRFKIVKEIDGSYTNVVGLPCEKIKPVLKKWLRSQKSTRAKT